MCNPLVDDIIHDEEIVRQAAAEALAATLDQHHEYITPTIDQLMQKYEEKSEVKYFIISNMSVPNENKSKKKM